MQVVELSSTKWLTAAAPLREPSPNLGKKISDSASGLNTNATPFVPSEPLLETVYDMPVLQQPVYMCVYSINPLSSCSGLGGVCWRRPAS